MIYDGDLLKRCLQYAKADAFAYFFVLAKSESPII